MNKKPSDHFSNYAKYKAAKLGKTAAKKIMVFVCKAMAASSVATAITIFLLVAIAYVLIAKEEISLKGVGTYTAFSEAVELTRPDVASICDDYGHPEYTNVILAIIQVETGGLSLDPMNAGDKIYNTRYPRQRGLIEDPLYSIKVGVQEFLAIVDELGIEDFTEFDKLLIAYQAYHFDRDYITYANENGGYNIDNAAQYLRESALPYYLRPTFATNVASFVRIMGGSISTFVYPVEDAEILYSFGEDLPNGNTASGTYFKTSAESEIYAISDGDVQKEVTGNYSITIEHGNYIFKYKLLSVYDDCIPKYIDPADEDEEGYWEEVYVTKGEEIGTTKYHDGNYQVFLQIIYNGTPIDPMTLLDIAIDPNYDPESGNDGLRDAVVDYAKLWLSTPYVWGGNNLATGVDCSGFMQQIYKNFGFSIPRVSRDQAQYSGVWSTTEVYPDVLLKGDLIFYVDNNGVVNHVTMYIGNGMIIGAQSTKSGIKIVQYNYRQPVKAIRIIP